MSSNKSENRLIIFVKFPEAGKVKTRLAKTIGEVAAAEIYSVIAKYIVDKFAVSEFYQTSVFYSPQERETDLKDWLSNTKAKFFAQKGNTLGDKISDAFESSVKNGAKNIVIIGTDCIEFTNDDIKSTFEILRDNRAKSVIGPASDGGYYLFGLNTFKKDIFMDIDWSTNKVFEQTVEKLRKNNLKFISKQTLNDIDEIEDINFYSLNKMDTQIAEIINSLIEKNRVAKGVA